MALVYFRLGSSNSCTCSVLQVLFGASVPFVGGDVVANVIQLVTALGSQGLVGLVAVGVLFWVFNRKV